MIGHLSHLCHCSSNQIRKRRDPRSQNRPPFCRTWLSIVNTIQSSIIIIIITWEVEEVVNEELVHLIEGKVVRVVGVPLHVVSDSAVQTIKIFLKRKYIFIFSKLEEFDKHLCSPGRWRGPCWGRGRGRRNARTCLSGTETRAGRPGELAPPPPLNNERLDRSQLTNERLDRS